MTTVRIHSPNSIYIGNKNHKISITKKLRFSKENALCMNPNISVAKLLISQNRDDRDNKTLITHAFQAAESIVQHMAYDEFYH